VSARLSVVSVAGLVLVQDGGRPGRMHEGIPPGGALVPELLAAANRALGNAPGEAALEIFGGCRLAAEQEAILVSLDGEPPRRLAPGESQAIGPGAARVRYLALRGGIELPEVLGGRGTLLVAAFGGLEGRGLRRGDRLVVAGRAIGEPRAAGVVVDLAPDAPLRVIEGPDRERFEAGALERLLSAEFQVSPASDRVGTRLAGPPLALRGAERGASLPMVRGAIQGTTGGEAIVLGPDHPTTGGYPVLATVIRADQGRLAARRPGARIRFRAVGLEEARAALGDPPDLVVRRAGGGELGECLALRHQVFVEGQGVPPALELDGLDPGCTHFVARLDGELVGTARLRVTEEGQAKAERVAVRGAARGRGIGAALMRALEVEARRRGFAELHLHAQAPVIPFYEALGYTAEGPLFEEAGIPHCAMRRRVF
jgi:allophanate hydrolase subunit 2/predicted GNAT family N-acyltransferase